MITVCMGENEETDTMRTWFDRSVAADFDFTTAYDNLRWGLRPRWLGSIADLTAFGNECAATGRFDTCVPYQLVMAAVNISSDSRDPQAPFSSPELPGAVLGVLDNYFAQGFPRIPSEYAHTLAAIAAHKLGLMDEAKRHLAAINYTPDRNRELQLMDDLPGLVAHARPSATP